jgi:ketosteroid isomerase-like protein
MINDPEVVAQVAALHEQYEAALVSNDIEKLITFFWDSSHALRFGVGESLYGAKAIEEFRRHHPPINLTREVSNLQVVTFGDDCAVLTFEFQRRTAGGRRTGRQTQVWRKFEEGWKIVSAHVSLVPVPYVDLASQLSEMPVRPESRESVQRNIDRAATIARPLLDLELDDSIEPAPVFEP